MKLSTQITAGKFGLEMSAEELRKFRRSKHESQGMFWSRFGVTQSRGSRFEKGAEIPKPVAILLELYFSGAVTDGDLKVGSMRLPGKHELSAQSAL